MTHSVSLATLERQSPDRLATVGGLRDLFRTGSIRTPAMLLSTGRVSDNYRALRAALPRVGIHYAVKPNSHPAILNEVRRLGGCFDVCSAGEITAVKPSRKSSPPGGF